MTRCHPAFAHFHQEARLQMICLDLTSTWNQGCMGDKSHKNINHSSVKALDMESCRIQLQCILYLPMHKCWITHESKGELFMHNEDPLPDKTELLLFRILKIIFSGTSSGFIWLGFGFLFCFTFFLSKHTLLCTLYPRQEQEGYSHGMTEILTQTRSARNLKRNISKI